MKEPIPSDVEALLLLPGIGRNTAHAIACFGFGHALPVMEANVRRVLCRVFALKAPDDKLLWEKAQLLLDVKNPFDYNQAMMDIGATVCTRRNPRCGECPLAVICKGKISPESYPQMRAKKAAPVRQRAIVVFTDGKRYHLTERTTRFLGGLYGFAEAEPGTQPVRAMLIGAVRQVYSHFTLEAKVWLMRVKKLPSGGAGVTLMQMRRLPLSCADIKVMRMLQERDFS